MTNGAVLQKENLSPAGIASLRNLGRNLTPCTETGKKQDA